MTWLKARFQSGELDLEHPRAASTCCTYPTKTCLPQRLIRVGTWKFESMKLCSPQFFLLLPGEHLPKLLHGVFLNPCIFLMFLIFLHSQALLRGNAETPIAAVYLTMASSKSTSRCYHHRNVTSCRLRYTTAATQYSS
jgi:hypothetical protein